MSASFRLINPKVQKGTLLNLRLMAWVAGIEYKRDETYLTDQGKVAVLMPVEYYDFLGGYEIASARLCYFVIDKLKESLYLPEPKLETEFLPDWNELEYLQKIDPNKVRPQEWVEISEKSQVELRKIFISCGQSNDNEKNLGKKIKILVDNMGFNGYFAENQQSLEGLTKNIFNEINNSHGLIAIMHKRERLDQNTFRGSLWIEQEIAIASFIKQTLGADFYVKAYIQRDIELRGVREKLQLNPIQFENDQEILDDLTKSLTDWITSLSPKSS